MQLDPKAAYTPEEILCIERAMQQWEASLKRPDLSERDRVRGAIEAYTRQAFALSALPSPEPTEAEVEALQDLLAEAAGVVKELLNGPMLGMSEPRRLTMADALNKAIPPANAALALRAASRSRPAEAKAGMVKVPEHLSPLPWKYERREALNHDWIEDAHGNIVVEHVGHIDGPFIVAAANAALEPVAEAKAERVAFPDDWVLVPREPTEAMLWSGWDNRTPSGELTGIHSVYAAMLAAAPASPVAQQRDGVKLKPLVDFAHGMMTAAFNGDDVTGEEIQNLAEGLGLIRKTAYDPAVHGSAGLEVCEPGDEWYEFSPWLSPERKDQSNGNR